MTLFFQPRLLSVQALAPYRLRTTWDTGETLEVDVEPILRRIPALAPILDLEIFNQVHLGAWGSGVEWLDEEFGADNVYAWAQEQAGHVSHEMFDRWLHRNQLSLQSAAEVLGISRRRVGDYRTARRPIPRTIWLACLGWEATRPQPGTVPQGLPSAHEYAASHA